MYCPYSCRGSFPHADGRVGQPDRGHELATSKFGEHQVSIRSVLQAWGARLRTFCTSAISTCQPARSNWSCSVAHSVIEIDRGANRLAVTLEASRQSAQTIRI
jgi:hypothetical protein